MGPLNKSLTGKQKRVLDNIELYIKAKGEPPTLDELRQNLGFRSLRTVMQYIETLERKGYIVRRRHARRNIELRGVDAEGRTATLVSVPVVANVGCDDLSVFAEEQTDEFLQVDKEIVDKAHNEIVAVRAVGDSMADAGVKSGDYILVQFTDKVKSGDRVAAIIGDMVTVKRLERRSGVTILYPESKDPKYKPIVLRDNFKIAGRVLCIIPAAVAEMEDVVPVAEEDWR
ncbi:MAG: LexA repressor, repressor LexA [Parcubacteria group bacterium GW2011_GWC1_45_13]|nr:MAG: LexA repressor, repressor LexA [Parcubacteria group bacterium GW2011_GWC1_45_13]